MSTPKKFKLALHNQILLALILGTAFGAFFNVNQHKLIIKTAEEKVIVKDWDNLTIFSNTSEKMNFSSDDQIQIINYFRKNSANISKIEYTADKQLKNIDKPLTVSKEKTIATSIKPLGTLFIRLLSFIAIPLVIASLIVGASSLKDFKKLGRIGGKTFLIYLTTTALAITIGVVLANVIQPGNRVEEDAKNRLMGAYQEESADKITQELDVDIVNFIVEIVPKNPIEAMTNGNMLQIVFFALIFGISLTMVKPEFADPVIKVSNGISETMIKMVDMIMKLAPFGVFALIAATIADFGFSIVTTLIWYIGAVILGLLLQTTLVYASLVKFLGKMSVIKFFKGIRNALAIAFSTSSSAATLPVTLECLEQDLGKPKEITGFVLPLGATINMDGTALYQGVAAIFISQIYGFDLTLVQQLTIIFTAVLASIGTAPVPGVGLIMLVIILQSVNVPGEGIAIILGVDRILDMIRTVTNVSGDAAVTVAIAGTEKT